jgi:zinc transport system permease protein
MFDIITGLILSYYINTAPGGMIALVSVGTLILILFLKFLLNILSTAKN